MSTPLSARTTLKIVDGQKYFQSFAMADSGGAPIKIVTGSGVGAITDSSGNEILALPSVADYTSTGIITTQEGIFSLSILKVDVLALALNITFNFDISVDLTDFPEISPHKPIRGNVVKLEGSYLA